MFIFIPIDYNLFSRFLIIYVLNLFSLRQNSELVNTKYSTVAFTLKNMQFLQSIFMTVHSLFGMIENSLYTVA